MTSGEPAGRALVTSVATPRPFTGTFAPSGMGWPFTRKVTVSLVVVPVPLGGLTEAVNVTGVPVSALVGEATTFTLLAMRTICDCGVLALVAKLMVGPGPTVGV